MPPKTILNPRSKVKKYLAITLLTFYLLTNIGFSFVHHVCRMNGEERLIDLRRSSHRDRCPAKKNEPARVQCCHNLPENSDPARPGCQANDSNLSFRSNVCCHFEVQQVALDEQLHRSTQKNFIISSTRMLHSAARIQLSLSSISPSFYNDSNQKSIPPINLPLLI